MCKTPAIADIVILVDGSWSIGRINFRLVRTFLENLIRAFSVDFDKTRIGGDVLDDAHAFMEKNKGTGLMLESDCSVCAQVWLSTVETPESSGT